MNRKLGVLLMGVALLFSSSAWATVPALFSVQGVLRDKSGALQSTTVTVVVNFFAAQMPTAGEKPLNAAPITLTGVGVTNGLFTVQVPLTPDLAATFARPQVWLEMTANSDTFPRQQVTPDVYALYAGTADVANSLGPALSTAVWIAPKLNTGWANYGGGYNDPGYYKDALGWVHLKGLITGPTAGASAIVFTLPAGYLPAQRYLTIGVGYSGAYVPARIDVDATGNVTITPTGTVQATWGFLSLDQVSFKAK